MIRWIALALCLLSGGASAQVGQVPMAVYSAASLPPTGPQALDVSTHAVVTSSVSSQALPSITTTYARETLVAFVAVNTSSVSSITDTAGLSWSRRATSGGSYPLEEWYATTSATLSSDIITVNFSAATSFADIGVGAFSGTHTSATFDTNGSLPAITTTAEVSISTTAADTIVVFGYRTGGGNPSTGCGAGFYVLYDDSSSPAAQYFAACYLVETSTQSSLLLTVNNNAGSINGGSGDALK